MPKFEKSLETQLSKGIDSEIRDWACGCMDCLAALQIKSKKKLTVGQINDYYKVLKTTFFEREGKKLPIIGVNGYINDFWHMTEELKKLIGGCDNFYHIGTKYRNQQGEIEYYIYPRFVNDFNNKYDMAISWMTAQTEYGKHFVLKDYTDFIIYNSNPEIKVYKWIDLRLYKEIKKK